MTGGSFLSLVFLNRYFDIDLKKVIYDAGAYLPYWYKRT